MALRRAAAFAGDGRIGTYLHFNAKVGVLAELAGPAKALASADATAFLADLGKHVAFAKPTAVARGGGREGARRQGARDLPRAGEAGPEDGEQAGAASSRRSSSGKLDKFYAETCLLEQPWVMDDKLTVKDVLEAASKKAGGEIVDPALRAVPGRRGLTPTWPAAIVPGGASC